MDETYRLYVIRYGMSGNQFFNCIYDSKWSKQYIVYAKNV